MTLRDPLEQQSLRDLRPDLLVVVAYGQLLPPEVLQHSARRLSQCACLVAATLARRFADSDGDSDRAIPRPVSA